MPDGSYQATIYAGPVNYQDTSGTWQPIDDSLVSSSLTGYAVKNRAGPYDLELPSDLASKPVRLAMGASSVSFQLVGAHGTGQASGQTDTYPNALPGVSVSYTAVNGGVKETATLAGASAPSSLTYALSASGLKAVASAAGGISFLDTAGRPQLSVPPPTATDAAGASGAVSMSLSATGDSITVAVDPGWLSSPDRSFPVTVDPSVTITGATQDCYIAGGSSANTHFCPSAVLKLGYDSSSATPYRSLLKFDLSAIPATSTVRNAQLGLHLAAATTQTAPSVALHSITQAGWTTAATWNAYDGTHTWTTPGGDFTSPASWTTQNVGPASGWYYWYPTLLAQGWVNQTTPNDGMILKEPAEDANQVLSFDSLNLGGLKLHGVAHAHG